MFKYCNKKFFHSLIKVLRIQNLKPVVKSIKNNGKQEIELFFTNFEGKPSLVFINNNSKNFNDKKYFLNISNYSKYSIIFYLRRYKAKQEIEKIIKKIIERRK